MITPSPTSRIDPQLARGVLAGTIPASATRPTYVRIRIPNTSYELHLVAGTPPDSLVVAPTGRIVGKIRCQARRVDVVRTGGRYVEPVIGRPQRVQGRVIGVNTGERSICVDAGVPMHVTLTDPRQKPEQFLPGELVSFDVLEGASFEQDGAPAERLGA
jgi:hypothetical protein